jgi:hypothetical protein
MLYVGTDPAREFDEDLKAASILKHTDAGKRDFHACRVAYVSRMIDAGAILKEAQSLARHVTPELTVNGYARVSSERLADVAERVGDNLRNTAGAKRAEGITPSGAPRESCVVPAAGIEPYRGTNRNRLMVRDFPSNGFGSRRFFQLRDFSRVLSCTPESTPVVERFWRNRPRLRMPRTS